MAGRKNHGAWASDPSQSDRSGFTPGNGVAVSHGADSPARVQQVAELLLEDLLGRDNVPPYLRDPSYGPAVRSWARAEAKALLVAEWLDCKTIDEQLTPPKQGTSAPLEVWRKLESAALTHRQRLGLDPLSRARLGRDLAGAKFDLAALMAQVAAEDSAA